MTLDSLGLDIPARVTAVRLKDEERARLGAVGLEAGASIVKLLRTPLRDPVECLVGSQLVALDRRVMAGILVAPETP